MNKVSTTELRALHSTDNRKTGQSFAKPSPIRGSVSIALDAQGDISKFYADGITYYRQPYAAA